ESVGRATGDERDEGEGADEDERRGLADGAGEREDRPGQDPGHRQGEDLVADGLPAGGTEGEGALSDRARHGADRLLRGDDDDRQDEERQGERAGDDAPAEGEGADEEG